MIFTIQSIRLIQLSVKPWNNKIVSNHYDFYKEVNHGTREAYIEQERLARSWSEYALAENSGLTQSTISTWRRRNLQPNVASIEKICAGFGITLSQFFQEEDSVYLTKEQKKLLDLWAKLSPVQREAVTKMLCAFLYI